MAIYRLYPLDHVGQVSGPPSRYYCDDDAAVLALAEKLRASGKSVEIWRESAEAEDHFIKNTGTYLEKPRQKAVTH